jgi:hypothetical protein
MFSYHNQIKSRINNGELTSFEFVRDYNGIKPAILLYFKTTPFIRPIRKHKFQDYKPILLKYHCVN